MQTLIAMTYPSQAKAGEVLDAMRRLEKGHLIEVEDACIVTRDADGKVQLHQTFNPTAAGAAGGAFWGTLIGVLFLNPLLGLVVGGAGGALSGATVDYGIDDQFMKGLAANLTPDASALFILLREATLDKVQTELAAHGGQVLYTNLSTEGEAALRSEVESPARLV